MLIHLSVEMNRAFSAGVWDFVTLVRCPRLLMEPHLQCWIRPGFA